MIVDLRNSDFADFFQTIHGYGPFPWQQALVDRLAECDEWPDVLDLPTGAGKTAALDAAVFHLALRADALDKTALRIALVVDRRLVVDDTFAHAKKIADVLHHVGSESSECEVVREVARRLQKLAGDSAPKPLIAQSLRGGMPLEHDWARTPTQPTILCSTVDQVGSRLLFRGYGVSDRMKPIHAGLLGTNSLILLDEAHLSEPFRQTLDAVQRIGGADVRMALLSATPNVNAQRRFELSQEDRSHPELMKRLKALKSVDLKVVRGENLAVAETFAKNACETMRQLKEEGVEPPVVGVIVNRVALARGIYEELLENPEKADTILLIGTSRDVDRRKIVRKLEPFRTRRVRHGSPLFVVATQCLEVGVDLDLDGLVTQAASLDALRQRFGRLNRAGRQISAKGVILARSSDIGKKADDPVYGDRIRKTWDALQQLADGDGTIDFGADVLSQRLQEAGCDMRELASDQPDAPVVMPAYLDLWSQTWPRPSADPEISLFLHGVERSAARVSLVWRGDIDEIKSEYEDVLEKLIRLVPPRPAEAVDVPLWAARAWLRNDGRQFDSVSDAPERESDETGVIRHHSRPRQAFRWSGPDDPRTGVVTPDKLRSGDVLVIPSEYGGCDEFGWDPDSSKYVSDVADEAGKPYWGRRCAVRVGRDVVQTDLQWNRLSAIITDESINGLDMVERILAVLPSTVIEGDIGEESDGHILRNIREPLKALKRARRDKIRIEFPYADQGKEAVFVAERGIEGIKDSNYCTPTTEDESFSFTSNRPVYLDDHSRRVADFVASFTAILGLSKFADDLSLAAFLHDAGKADPRFQIMLSGGDIWNQPDRQDQGPLAKSGGLSSPSTSKSSGLPKGWRHESLSVQMARAHPRFVQARDPALVLWLIGSHHGFGRPFFNFVDPTPEIDLQPCLGASVWSLNSESPGPHSLAFDFQGDDWPSMFKHLKRKYGIWRLAYLEAILRLADHRASEEEENIS